MAKERNDLTSEKLIDIYNKFSLPTTVLDAIKALQLNDVERALTDGSLMEELLGSLRKLRVEHPVKFQNAREVVAKMEVNSAVRNPTLEKNHLLMMLAVHQAIKEVGRDELRGRDALRKVHERIKEKCPEFAEDLDLYCQGKLNFAILRAKRKKVPEGVWAEIEAYWRNPDPELLLPLLENINRMVLPIKSSREKVDELLEKLMRPDYLGSDVDRLLSDLTVQESEQLCLKLTENARGGFSLPQQLALVNHQNLLQETLDKDKSFTLNEYKSSIEKLAGIYESAGNLPHAEHIRTFAMRTK